MSTEWASIVVTAGVFGFGIVLTVIGWLVKDKLTTIGDDLHGLSANQGRMANELVEVKTTVKHHSEKQDEFCSRLEKVETSVSNTERIALMELRLTKAEEELAGTRRFGHWVRNVLSSIAGKVGADLPKEYDI
jgi:hypothetical protein